MTKLFRFCLLTLCLFVWLCAGNGAMAETRTIIEPKAENFLFYVDNSGSMGFDYKDTGMKKSIAARDLLLTINNELPELQANFGVYSYGPFRQYRQTGSFNRQDMADAFEAIPVQFDIFGRQTPMGDGLMSLDASLAGLQDRMAVIAVTDGESNIGVHPRDVMKDIYSRYGNRICFHFISFAQTADEKAFVDDLAGLNPCSYKADASDLANDSVREAFLKNVFYDVRTITIAPPPPPEPEPAPAPVEEVIVFSNVNFDFDSAVIKPEYREILKEAAQIIKDRTDKSVAVEGHTCNMGPAVYNMGLSQRRAQSVADFLVDQGVSRDRLETEGYGLTRPKFDNNTREGRSLNRRVEMRLK